MLAFSLDKLVCHLLRAYLKDLNLSANTAELEALLDLLLQTSFTQSKKPGWSV
jgi:hypothetical protein